MSEPDTGLGTPSFWERNDSESSGEGQQNPYLERNGPRNRSSSSSSSGRSNDWLVGGIVLNGDPELLERYLLEHEMHHNPVRCAGCGEEQQNVEPNEPVLIYQNDDLAVRRLFPTTSERPHSTFWPEGICTLKCVDRCTQFLLSIALTIVGIVGGMFSLYYFERPVGWALMSFTTALAGVVLMRKTLLRLCCP